MLGDKKISEIMTAAPLNSIKFNSPVYEVAIKMKNTGKSFVIVTKDDEPVGIISERDIIRRVVAEKLDPTTTKASDIMSSPILGVDPNDTVSDVAKYMDDRGIRRVIVMKKGLILGAVTAKDFVKVIVTEGNKDVEFFRAMMRSSAARY